MIYVYPTARRGSRERTSGQQQRQRSFPQICPGGTPDKYTIHPAGNTARKYHLTVIVLAKPIRSTMWISICVYNWSHLCPQNNEEASGAAEDGASEEEETEAEAGFIKRTAYASIPMQMHYHNTTTSLTQFLPSGPSCISQPSIHIFLSTFFFMLGCVFENLFTASCHWLSRWLQITAKVYFLFLRVFVWWHAYFVSFSFLTF